MAEGRETRVSYKAIAEFANLHRELRKTRTEIAKTQAAEKAFNSSASKSATEFLKTQETFAKIQQKSVASTKAQTEAIKKNTYEKNKATKSNVRFVESVGDIDLATEEVVETTAKATESTNRWGKALEQIRSKFQNATKDTVQLTRAQEALERARNRHTDTSKQIEIAEINLANAIKKTGEGSARTLAAELRLTRARRAHASAANDVTNATKKLELEHKRLPDTFRRVEQGGNRLYNAMQKFANWRPRLVPPFVALIPIIGAVVAAINPLIALMGSLGSVAIGLAGSIGSLSGAFLALPGILSAVVAGISSVIASMGGVGSVFKAYSAMQKATNSARGGSGGPTQAERADALADAEWNLSKAQRSVQKAQENLNKAREKALEDLIKLRLEVSRASMNEERAIANLRKAQEEYWNVMADPGSTLGDKLDAAVSIKEAEADLEDVRKRNIENQKELTEAEKKGVESSEQVIDAQERLTDAMKTQRDAQKALNKEQAGGAAGASAAQAIDEYNRALNELSPSARKFVLAILAMEDQWKSFKGELQENFFSRFAGDLERLPRLLNTLKNFLLPASGAMGDFVSNFLTLMDSPEWSSDMATIGEQNAVVIQNLGEGFLALAGAFKDIIIAAGPFTEWMTNGFAEGSKNFEKFVGNARETGQLASWLDKVASRMQKWWQVVKNVGATIFNYSAAAEEFGGWLLDGFVNLSDGWKKASEDARKEGSPFREYLEDIKPLLSEVKGLFGDFFGWLRREMMDPENIQDAQDLVKIIREDLGPAISGLLDALAATDIDEKFVKAMSSIIESLTTIIENGGGAAFETFFDVVEGFFDFLADFTESLDPDVLEAVLSFVGGLAAVVFVGKFTGATNLLGAILGLNGKNSLFASLTTFVDDFKKLDKLQFKALLGKAGLLAGIAALALVTLNQVNNTKPFQDSMGEFFANPTDKNAGSVVDQGVQDGTGLKWLTGPSSPLSVLSPGGGGINLGAISEVLNFIDDIFNTKLNQEFSNFLEDITGGLIQWSTVELPNWWAGVTGWWNGTVVPTWNGFWAGLGQAWTSFWSPIAQWWTDNVATPLSEGWQAFQNTLQAGWNWIDQFIITPFKNGFNTLTTTIGTVVDGMANKWAELRKKFAEPVNFVIDSVYNNGIRSFWNGINSSLSLNLALPYINTVKFADGGVMPETPRRRAYATGGVLPGYTPGRDVHDFVSPTGGRLSLSGGEAIMRPEFTKLVGGKKGVDELNKKAIRGQAFAKGGVFNGGTTQHFAGGGIWEVAGDLWDKFTGFFNTPAKFIRDGIGNLINPLLGGIGGGNFGKMLSAIPGRIVDSLVGFSTEKAKNAKRKQPAISEDGSGMKWQSMWAAVKAAFPGASLNSAYRSPGANAAVGGVSGSYHTRGRAIDVNPSSAIFNWIKQNYPSSRELIYSPMGGQQLLNGRNHFWGEPVRSDHWDHVHWAMKKGGVVPGLYDNGGWLPHGGLAVNKSGKPEAVLDPQESRALKSLLAGSGLGATPAFSARAASAAIQSAPQIIDNSINIEKVEIINPVPEEMSESLPKSIRRMGYMNEARTRK